MRFYEKLKEGQEYAVLSVTLDLFKLIQDAFISDTHYTIHLIKENNPKFKEDELLKELYSKKSKLMREITKREQQIK